MLSMSASSFELSTPVIETLLSAAMLAPSSHNTQPWLFRPGTNWIELLADRRRALPVNDPDDRELTISCGCALLNLRVAAAAADLQTELQLLPPGGDPDRLARLHFSPASGPQPDAELAPFLAARHTCRQRFGDAALEPATILALVAAVNQEGAHLHLLESVAQRQGAAALVAEGDAQQWADASWRRELAAWMHPRRSGDGLVVPALTAPLTQLMVRSFDMGQGIAARDSELADASPLLAVLATAGDTPADWLAAGQALQRLLLVGVQHGLQCSYLNQAVQRSTLRPRLAGLMHGDFDAPRTGLPQMVLRCGTPLGELQATPRRPLTEVIVAA